jgi:hypothetical protein
MLSGGHSGFSTTLTDVTGEGGSDDSQVIRTYQAMIGAD